MLILLLIALAATLRLFFCAPAQVAKRQKNANDALLVWYRAAEDALLCMGLSSLPGEAPASFLWRAQCELHDAVKLTGLGKALCVAQYSGRTLKPIQPGTRAQGLRRTARTDDFQTAAAALCTAFDSWSAAQLTLSAR